MVIGTNFSNFIAYVYHFIFARILEPAKYGELASTLTLLGLLTTSFVFLSLVVVKFISTADKKDVEVVFSWFIKKSAAISFLLAILILALSPAISKFMHVDVKIILLIGPILFFSVFLVVTRATLQGLMKFRELVVSNTSEMLGRLIFGLILVMVGWEVFGAFVGILVSIVFSLLLTKNYLKDFKIIKVVRKFEDGEKVFSYGLPIFIASLASNMFFSTDVILVKHFFSSYDAGLYAALSNLGKIIFYGASPVTSVMFPMVSKRHSQGGNFHKIFIFSLLLTSLIAGGILTLYFLFPNIAILTLYGKKYVQAAPNLFWFGTFMTIFTIGSLFMNYFLSRNKTKVVWLVIGGALLQIVGIWFFHKNMITVIRVSTLSATLCLASLLIYFVYETKSK